MKVIDLSHKIEEDMSTYTDDAKPIIKEIASIESDGYNEKSINLFSHTGTHADAPYHMIKNGKSLDEYDISKFIGDAILIDITNINMNSIDINIIKEYEEDIKNVEFVILRTGWDKYWKTDKYFDGFPTLTPEATKWICSFNIKGIGIDTISIDSSTSVNFEIHNIILANDKIIIENLTNLQAIKEKKFKFLATPLKYNRADGSSVRAIAII